MHTVILIGSAWLASAVAGAALAETDRHVRYDMKHHIRAKLSTLRGTALLYGPIFLLAAMLDGCRRNGVQPCKTAPGTVLVRR